MFIAQTLDRWTDGILWLFWISSFQATSFRFLDVMDSSSDVCVTTLIYYTLMTRNDSDLFLIIHLINRVIFVYKQIYFHLQHCALKGVQTFAQNLIWK